MTKSEKKLVIKRLYNFKQNYNLTSKQIAQELNTTEAVVSHWFSGDSLPRINKIEEILKLFNKYCIPGIIRIPKNSHWLATFFLRVEDIKDPYLSWIDDGISGENPENFKEWIKDWSVLFPKPIIYRQYEPSKQNIIQCQLDTIKLNTAVQFRNYFIYGKSIKEVFRQNPGINPYALDYEFIDKLINGEDDGTT